MPRQFAHSTAELVMQVTEAVQAIGKADETFVQVFCDLSQAQVHNALQLAVDIGFLEFTPDQYTPASPLVGFIATPDESRKAAILRIMLESYEPFVTFRTRLLATGSADTAALQTKACMNLSAHREEIKDTLISLGTYANALVSKGGGRYAASQDALENQLHALAAAANDQAAAELTIRNQIGQRAEILDRGEVLIPLANALLNASAGRSADAVTDAARAVESFLARLAERQGVNLTGANGINQKLDKFRAGNHLPKKVIEAAKYLGHVRNAADHGVDVDPDVGSVWHIQQSTGLQFVYVACSFISAALEREAGNAFAI